MIVLATAFLVDASWQVSTDYRYGWESKVSYIGLQM